MIDEQELNAMTKNQILESIKNKNTLLGQMVGNLYPSIVRGEIRQLYIQLEKTKHK